MSSAANLVGVSDFEGAVFSAPTKVACASWLGGCGGFVVQAGSTEELAVDVPPTTRHIVMLWAEPHKGQHEARLGPSFAKLDDHALNLFFLPAGHQSSWRHRHGYPRALQFHFEDEFLLSNGCSSLVEVGCLRLVDTQIATFLRRSAAEIGSGNPGRALMLDAIGTELALSLSRAIGGKEARSFVPVSHGRQDWRLKRARELMEARLSEDVGLGEIASVVELSPSHLASLFRADSGEPPHRWLMRRRVERACEMLADPRQSVTQVAAACGFASSQHLATAFRRRLGVTPSAYRRERLY